MWVHFDEVLILPEVADIYLVIPQIKQSMIKDMQNEAVNDFPPTSLDNKLAFMNQLESTSNDAILGKWNHVKILL